MNEITFDVESTTFQKGNPFSKRNKLCAVGLLNNTGVNIHDIEYSNTPYGHLLPDIKDQLEMADILIGFNIKFDLHWIKRYCPEFRYMGRVWDCQLAEFILGAQSRPYPSLDDSCERRGIAGKLDVVRSEYWDKGFDTTEVPWGILSEYLEQDLRCTYELYLRQVREFEEGDPRRYVLFKAQCADLLVLQDAEWNGLRYNEALAIVKGDECDREIVTIDQELRELVESSDINWNSGDHLSAILYGGCIYRKVRVPTTRILKNGQVKQGEKWGEEAINFRGMVRPLPRSETKPTNQWDDETLAKINAERLGKGMRPLGRVYSTDEPTLRSLNPRGKKAKRIIELVLRRSAVEKLVSTYYRGLTELIKEKDWDEGTIHGAFNQCVAATGRLSSSGPNLQNFAKETKELFYTRFPE